MTKQRFWPSKLLQWSTLIVVTAAVAFWELPSTILPTQFNSVAMADDSSASFVKVDSDRGRSRDKKKDRSGDERSAKKDHRGRKRSRSDSKPSSHKRHRSRSPSRSSDKKRSKSRSKSRSRSRSSRSRDKKDDDVDNRDKRHRSKSKSRRQESSSASSSADESEYDSGYDDTMDEEIDEQEVETVPAPPVQTVPAPPVQTVQAAQTVQPIPAVQIAQAAQTVQPLQTVQPAQAVQPLLMQATNVVQAPLQLHTAEKAVQTDPESTDRDSAYTPPANQWSHDVRRVFQEFEAYAQRRWCVAFTDEIVQAKASINRINRAIDNGRVPDRHIQFGMRVDPYSPYNLPGAYSPNPYNGFGNGPRVLSGELGGVGMSYLELSNGPAVQPSILDQMRNVVNIDDLQARINALQQYVPQTPQEKAELTRVANYVERLRVQIAGSDTSSFFADGPPVLGANKPELSNKHPQMEHHRVFLTFFEQKICPILSDQYAIRCVKGRNSEPSLDYEAVAASGMAPSIHIGLKFVPSEKHVINGDWYTDCRVGPNYLLNSKNCDTPVSPDVGNEKDGHTLDIVAVRADPFEARAMLAAGAFKINDEIRPFLKPIIFQYGENSDTLNVCIGNPLISASARIGVGQHGVKPYPTQELWPYLTGLVFYRASEWNQLQSYWKAANTAVKSLFQIGINGLGPIYDHIAGITGHHPTRDGLPVEDDMARKPLLSTYFARPMSNSPNGLEDDIYGQPDTILPHVEQVLTNVFMSNYKLLKLVMLMFAEGGYHNNLSHNVYFEPKGTYGYEGAPNMLPTDESEFRFLGTQFFADSKKAQQNKIDTRGNAITSDSSFALRTAWNSLCRNLGYKQGLRQLRLLHIPATIHLFCERIKLRAFSSGAQRVLRSTKVSDMGAVLAKTCDFYARTFGDGVPDCMELKKKVDPSEQGTDRNPDLWD